MLTLMPPKFLGTENLSNAEAVKNLSSLGRRRLYARLGTKLSLGRNLPGVRIDVLDPPTLQQTRSIAKQRVPTRTSSGTWRRSRPSPPS
jgi:hypothetical protein